MKTPESRGEENNPTSRNTKQKALILGCLRSCRKTHITADEIMDALKASGTPVAKSTVYRYLAQLEEGGEVRKYLLVEGSPACYQYVGDTPACLEHYHLMCGACGQIVHFEDDALQAVFHGIQERSALAIDGIRTVFYGTCPACAARAVAP